MESSLVSIHWPCGVLTLVILENATNHSFFSLIVILPANNVYALYAIIAYVSTMYFHTLNSKCAYETDMNMNNYVTTL